MIRIISALVMAVLIAAAVWTFPIWAFDVLLLLIVFAGLAEYVKMFFADKYERLAVIASGMCASASMLFSSADAEIVIIAVTGALFFLMLFFMWRTRELAHTAERIGLAAMGLLYIGVAFSFWGWLRALPFGRELVFLSLAPACLCDTFALIAGKNFGRSKFAPLVSPNKTMEGFFGALIGSFVGVMLIKWIMLKHIPFMDAAIFALVIWITSPFGDLVESLLKRSSGVKDSGNLIPGHGGILDRLDALIFTGPAAYVLAKYVMGM